MWRPESEEVGEKEGKEGKLVSSAAKVHVAAGGSIKKENDCSSCSSLALALAVSPS